MDHFYKTITISLQNLVIFSIILPMMKKIFCFLLQLPLYALYVGNPAEPQLIDQGFFMSQDSFATIKIGYQGDAVFDRKLRAQGGARGPIDRFKIHMDQGAVTLNLIDRIEVYGSLGSFNATLWDRPKADGKRREYETRDHWTAGGGLRILLMQWKHTILGCDGKVQYSAPRVKWVTVDGTASSANYELTYREWQLSLAVSHTIDIFTPYLAAQYSAVHADINGIPGAVLPHSHFKMHARERFGMAVGCSFSNCKKFDLNIEARLISEQAATLAANLKF